MESLVWLRQRWNHFWFEPTEPANLGLCRIIFFGSMLLLSRVTDTALWATVPDAFWMPITIFKALSIPVGPGDTLLWLDRIWIVSLALSCVGFLTRGSTVVAFILGAYLLGLPHNFGKTHHSDAILVLTLGILALSRCGDAWSLDRLARLGTGPRGGEGRGGSRRSAEYRWPIRLVWVLMAIVFFSAGVSKMRESGLAWIFSENLRFQLLRHQYSHVALGGLAPMLAQHLLFTKLMAAGSVALELSAPLALFSRRLRMLIIPSLLLLQTGIWALMGVSFAQYLAAYAFWVPWDRVAQRIGLRHRGKDPICRSPADPSPAVGRVALRRVGRVLVARLRAVDRDDA